MAKVIISEGLSDELFLTRLKRTNGLHIVQVHNGVITHHSRLEEVEGKKWVQGALERITQRSARRTRQKSSARRKKKVTSPPEDEATTLEPEGEVIKST